MGKGLEMSETLLARFGLALFNNSPQRERIILFS